MECTNAVCSKTATRVMAVPHHGGSWSCVYVSPYCDEHTSEVESFGAVPAAGPALSEQARKIDGIR